MLNENIKALRKAKGLSQEELAIKLNVVRQTVSKWEKALSVPDAGMVIQIAEALDTNVSVLLGEETPEPEEQESTKALAAKLEVLNEQFAKHSEKKRRIWRTVFVTIGILALIGFMQEILSFVHLHQFNKILESSESLIGGKDGPTSIFVSHISFQGFSALLTVVAGIVAVVGIHQTKRK